jgi:hypothetical protein
MPTIPTYSTSLIDSLVLVALAAITLGLLTILLAWS